MLATDTNAIRLLESIETALQSLTTLPERGSYPKELLALGIQDYRQILFKSYRMICRIIGQQVYVYLIVDGRRDMHMLLARRMLGG